MPKLYNVIKESLKRPTGIAYPFSSANCIIITTNQSIILDHYMYASYVAAKTMYFGVGGGMLPFKQLVETDGIFNIEVVFNVANNVKREVLELKYK